jgi:hypothetical protein
MQNRDVTLDGLVGGYAEAARCPKRGIPVVPFQSLLGELAGQRWAIGKHFCGILRPHQLRPRCQENRRADHPKGTRRLAFVEG